MQADTLNLERGYFRSLSPKSGPSLIGVRSKSKPESEVGLDWYPGHGT